MLKGLQNQKGVTLIELLAVVAIIAVVLIAISTVQIQFIKTFNEVSEGSLQNSETAFFMNVVNDEVRNAEEIMVSENMITLTKESGEETTFVFDKNEMVIKIQKENGIDLTLLTGVQDYQGILLKEKKKIGIQLDLQIKSGHQIFPFKLIAYSYIGVKGN